MKADNFTGMSLRQPALRWQDALPCGNGTVGALVYGHIKSEVIVLNHEALFLKRPKPQIEPLDDQCIPKVRAMLLEGRYQEGLQFFSEKLNKNCSGFAGIDPYQPAFDIRLNMETKKAFTAYRRYLDFEDGQAVVAWNSGNESYVRRLFVSQTDDAVILEVAAKNTTMNCSVALVPHDIKGEHGVRRPAAAKEDELPFNYTTEVQGQWVFFKAVYSKAGEDGKDGDDSAYGKDNEYGEEFGGVAHIIAEGGVIESSKDFIDIKGADMFVVMVKLFVNEKSDIAVKRLKAELSKMNGSYDEMLKRHAAVHGHRFNRLRLDLGDHGRRSLTNEELLFASYDGDCPTSLIQKMFEFGRYLLISSSRPGGLPANLQGVWNGDYFPAWSSDYHNDENVQMNYWAALPGNLPETALPYFDYFESMLDDFKTNAKAVYGCRGILAPIAQTTHGLLYCPNEMPLWTAWTAGAGWLAQLFYDYWQFTGEDNFLRDRAVPFLKEVAFFYEDFLVEGEDGRFLFVPSLSPENQPSIPEASLVTINAAMDVAVAREVLNNLCCACEHLGIENDGVKRWKAILHRLPEYEINEDGAIREWLYPGLKDNYRHRHQSHIYPLFPGLEVTEESNPELFGAMKTAVEKRLVVGLDSQTGWSFAHMANIYARLGDGDRALECLELLCRSCVGQNLFTYHNDWRRQGVTLWWDFGNGGMPPFQIDANFGLTAAVLEMLVFSSPDMIKLLPALPSKWKRGKAEGLQCRSGVSVSLDWDMEGKKLKAVLISKTNKAIALKLPCKIFEVDCIGADISYGKQGGRYLDMKLEACRTAELNVHF